jgi:guanylate kinase
MMAAGNPPAIAIELDSDLRTTDRRPVVISGPSGVGKGTLIQMLKQRHPGVFTTTVSRTTRSPRPGEEEGKAYYFVTVSHFQSLLSQNALIEHTFFNGNCYGTSKQTVEAQGAKSGARVLLDIEMQGVKQMKAGSGIEARYVFIKPPSFALLESRLRIRGTEEERDVQRRLAQAKIEVDYAETGVHDKVIVNDELEEAYKELEEFIFSA